MASTPLNDDTATRPKAPIKERTKLMHQQGEDFFQACDASPIAVRDMDESRTSSPTPSEERRTENEGGGVEDDSEEERRRREEEESIVLARALMAEEAMAVSYHMSVDYLRNNRDQFSEEDLAALQAAMEDDEHQEAAAELEETGDDGGMSYEMMLRLGEQLGDVKTERWSRIAREKIDALPTFTFHPKSANGKDENDSEVKCLICQFAYEASDCLRRLPCGHCFHRECVDEWLLSKDICAYCRKPIVEEA